MRQKLGKRKCLAKVSNNNHEANLLPRRISLIRVKDLIIHKKTNLIHRISIINKKRLSSISPSNSMLKLFGLYSFILIILIFVLNLFPAYGKIYIWTDNNGIKQFSNISPPQYKKHGVYTLDETSGKSSIGNFQSTNPNIKFLKKYNKFKVIKVYDGDTIKVRGKNNLVFVVRFAGIDAPETRKKDQPGQPYGKKAKDMVNYLIYGKEIFLKTYGTGGYNRVLAEIFTEDGMNINLELVRNGLAEVYRGRTPYGFNISPYLKAQAAAKRESRGIWSLGAKYESPRQWRREHPWKKE